MPRVVYYFYATPVSSFFSFLKDTKEISLKQRLQKEMYKYILAAAANDEKVYLNMYGVCSLMAKML